MNFRHFTLISHNNSHQKDSLLNGNVHKQHFNMTALHEHTEIFKILIRSQKRNLFQSFQDLPSPTTSALIFKYLSLCHFIPHKCTMSAFLDTLCVCRAYGAWRYLNQLPYDQKVKGVDSKSRNRCDAWMTVMSTAAHWTSFCDVSSLAQSL